MLFARLAAVCLVCLAFPAHAQSVRVLDPFETLMP